MHSLFRTLTALMVFACLAIFATGCMGLSLFSSAHNHKHYYGSEGQAERIRRLEKKVERLQDQLREQNDEWDDDDDRGHQDDDDDDRNNQRGHQDDEWDDDDEDRNNQQGDHDDNDEEDDD